VQYYCTLFDKGYLTRGLALYESLKQIGTSFHLYILTFDALSQQILQTHRLEYVTIIPLSEFENDSLLSIKATRSRTEYYWTCTSFLIKYVLETFKHNLCTYLDADLYFFGKPEMLFEEMGTADALITPHRYAKKHEKLAATSGIYCVQFMPFRNTKNGMHILNWWANACFDCCPEVYTNGCFGDQKYLDDWPERFKNVHVLTHLGGGIGPWNVEQYELMNDKLIVKKTGESFSPIFFHFHGLKIYHNGTLTQGMPGYQISSEMFEKFYRPYLKKLHQMCKEISTATVNGLEISAQNQPKTPILKTAIKKILGRPLSKTYSWEEVL